MRCGSDLRGDPACRGAKDVPVLFWQHLQQDFGRPSVPLPSLAGKQDSLWKVLSVHCGFAATVSTSTILVHLTSWPPGGGSGRKLQDSMYSVGIVIISQIFVPFPVGGKGQI